MIRNIYTESEISAAFILKLRMGTGWMERMAANCNMAPGPIEGQH